MEGNRCQTVGIMRNGSGVGKAQSFLVLQNVVRKVNVGFNRVKCSCVSV